MFLLDTTEKLLITAFLVTTMLGIGMQTRPEDLHSLMTSKDLLVRTILSNFLMVPIAGAAIISFLPLQRPVAGALLLLACTPGGISSLQFTSRAKGSAARAGAIPLLLSLLAVFISPWILQLALPGKVQVVIPYGRTLVFLMVFMALPSFAGMLMLNSMPRAAGKLAKPVGLAGIAAFVAFMVVSRSIRQTAAGEIGAVAVGAMLLLVLASMTIGWVIGGPTANGRRILASATSMRNAALCLAIVHSSAPGHAVLVPLIAFSLIMVPPNMLFTIFSVLGPGKGADPLPPQ